MQATREKVTRDIREKYLSNSLDLLLSSDEQLKLRMASAQGHILRAMQLLSPKEAYRGFNRIMPQVHECLRQAQEKLKW